MTGELVKFGVVMLVVVSGFVMSFYSLYKDTQTYGEVLFMPFLFLFLPRCRCSTTMIGPVALLVLCFCLF